MAKTFPDVKFEHATGYKRAYNVATYSARFYEVRYILGQIAGRMSLPSHDQRTSWQRLHKIRVARSTRGLLMLPTLNCMPALAALRV